MTSIEFLHLDKDAYMDLSMLGMLVAASSKFHYFGSFPKSIDINIEEL